MDSKKVKALLSSVEHGSLTAAAEELGYTQSGLTHMMNSLEEELGLSVLIRSKQGVRLSPAGHELLSYMQEFLRTAEELERSAEALRERSTTTLRLGTYSSVARHWMPSILSNYRRESPETEVYVTMASINAIYELIKRDELDCAIVSYQASLCQGLSWIPLRSDALVAVLPADAGERFFFPVEEFGGQEFLMPGDGFELDILPALSIPEHKVSPRIRYTNLDDDIVASMVEHHLGVSILSELVMQGIRSRVCALPLAPPSFRQFGIIVSERRRSDRNMRRFITCAQNTIDEMYLEHNDDAH